MRRMLQFAQFCSITLAVWVCVFADAQVPVALPNTITTLAGGAASVSSGAACPSDPSLTATDALGDGCTGTSVQFSSDLRGGVAVDLFDNIWVADSSNSVVRKIDGRSHIVTLAAGRGTPCAAKTDSNGDGCPFASTVFSSAPRGIGVDPWGNVLVAGYGSSLINVLCNATSPLCPNTPGNRLVGNMYAVAGCVATTSSAGTAGNGVDGGIALPTGTCSTSVAEINQPRGVTGDAYGNVYIADTANTRYRVVLGPSTYNGVSNPMYAIVGLNSAYTAAAGHIYGILGGFTAPSSGAACSTGSSVTSTDALGDGCPYFVTSTNAGSSSAQGVAVDPAGNVIFAPAGDQRLRVLYVGGAAMAHLITVSNPAITTPVVGSVYLLAGGGTTSPSATPVLASKVTLDTAIFKVATATNGDIYIGDGTSVLYLDGTTGYLRKLFATGSACAGALDSIGDGCAAANATFGGSNGLGIALDSFNNLYMADTTNSRVREVAAVSLTPTSMNATSSQNVVLHNSATSSATALTSSGEISLGTAACGAVNADNTVECSVPVTFAPNKPGLRSADAATTGAANGTLVISGIATGSVLAVDSAAPTTTVAAASIKASAVAVSTSGNVYAIDATTGNYVLVTSNGVTVLGSGAPTTNATLAVDSSETLYAVGGSSTNVSTLTLGASGTYTPGSIAYTPVASPAAPRAIAVDANQTLYVYDATNQAVYHFAANALSEGAPMLLSNGFTNVSSLALDGFGNVYAADKGAQTVVRVSPLGVQTTVLTGVTPAAIATDAGNALYVQDAATNTVQVRSSGGVSTTILSGLTQPSGVAVMANGDVISADRSGSGLTTVARHTVSYGFGSSTTATFAGTVSNAGNLLTTGFAQTDASDYALAAGATNGCNFASTTLSKGASCTFSVTFTPTGSGTGAVSDVLTLTPAASSAGQLTFTGTKTGSAVTTGTSVGGQLPVSPVYTPSGTEVTFTVTVTPSSGSATGTVNVSIDGGTAMAYTLSNNGVSVPLNGLAAGPHMIQASYPSQGGIVGSSSSVVNFSIAQATTSVTWNPTLTTEPVSVALGTGVLNATANGVPGAFVYSATPSGGSASAVDAASYLPIGTYALTVTFTPTDSTDYSGSTGVVASFMVTQATTTSMIGATTNLVAADGSGNYTTLTAAVTALPSTGGTIYMAPGTYTEQVSIGYPNVSLRGLGGDATKVVLTAEAGATTTAQNGGTTGDQGSSTLNVAKITIGGTTYTPNNFYAEYLTINNTWNTDTNVNPTALVSSNGSCVANLGNLSNSALYNAGTLCYSQALAVWITSDQAVFNNVRLNSLQDTLYAGSQGSNGARYTPARQYFWKGYISGDVDYIFGDAALVFDQTLFYTAWHGTSATGTATISAQNKAVANGATNDYLSGYVFNGATLTSQSTGMMNLYIGRPYGQFSTHILLNTKIDQINPLGWTEFSGQTNLPTSTYAEYSTTAYTDAQGNTGQGVSGPRETTSIAPQVYMSAAQAAKWAPVAFLGTAVNGISWNPTTALANYSNAYTPTNAVTAQTGTSVTLLFRPQTPGAGVVPTGTYSIYDNGSLLKSGMLDASGAMYYTTTTLPVGPNSITASYSGDANFMSSASTTAYTVTISPSPKTTPMIAVVTTSGATYGQTVNAAVTITGTGNNTPTGTVSISVDGGAFVNGMLSSGMTSFPLSGLAAGSHSLNFVYNGDTNYNTTNAMGNVSLMKASLTVKASSQTIAYGTTAAAYSASVGGYVNSDTASTAFTGSPSLTTVPVTPTSPGMYTITASIGSLSSANYGFTFANGTLTISAPAKAAAVATGDTRTLTEPTFPGVCMQLIASLADVNGDIPTSIDATNTNPDGSRIQAALSACASGQAVELSAGSGGNDAFLTGPLVLPTGVTLLIDPGVTMYGSRNAQDYDSTPGTHTCGTVNSNSATSSCKPLILINGVSNAGIMGYGKINGRGGDVVLNSFPASYAGQSWWGLSTIANSGGNQQNPRMIQMGGSASNITLYKITLMNSTLFHVSTTGTVNGFTAWDVKIVTPTSARNTDGIDPGNVNNFTVTQSYISDGDDNIAVGASGSNPATNISITSNHFYAGHGESIGSYTSGGVSNVLFDGNMLAGNGSADSNSTGVRIKSANDRGGLVQNIQYSNSCFQNHKTLIQFTPLYNTDTGTQTPNFQNILLQNLTFLTEGTVQLTGASNNGTVNPLTVRLDNVGFATLQTSDLNSAPSNTIVALGPGQVSPNFVAAINSFNGTNGVVVNDTRSVNSLLPPSCVFTYLAPELTGPQGVSQTIAQGQAATAVIILTPTVAATNYPYPTGTVTLTDQLSGATTTVTLPGNSDTVQVPLIGLTMGTHIFTASYGGDSIYVPTTNGMPYVSFGSYVVTVSGSAGSSTTTTLTGVPLTAPYGTSVPVTANVTGTTTGSVDFLVNGVVYTTSSLASGSATASLNLMVGNYTLTAQYTGSGGAAASTSLSSPLTVGPASTSTGLTTSTAITTVGVQVKFTATVSSTAGTPAGLVIFAVSVNGSAASNLGSATLTNGVANFSSSLPQGAVVVTATYAGSSNFSGSTSSTVPVTVNPPTVYSLPTGPIALPVTVSTVAGGAAGATANTACTGSTDSFGNGCQATQIAFNGSSLDLRSVSVDPFGNIYLTDANASQVRRISTSGQISNFAGYVSGNACLPTATSPCMPTLVKLNKPRGVSVDGVGNVFIGGYGDNKVYEVKVADGLLYLIAGTGTKPSDPTQANGDGGAATAATINQPRSAVADTYGNVYIADTADNKVRLVTTSGNIQTVAGTGVSSSTGDGGAAASATLSNPQSVSVDASSNLYIADAARVRVVCVTCVTGSPLYSLLNKLGVSAPVNGNIYTLAGTGTGSSTNNYTVPALGNTINVSPQKLAMDVSGDLYIADSSGIVWLLDGRSGLMRLLAGQGTGCNGSTIGDGCTGTQASIGTGTGGGIGVGVDLLGNLYIADTLNARIRKISNNLGFPATPAGVSVVQPITLHLIAGDTLGVATLPLVSSDFTIGTVTCVTNADTTHDCSLSATFTPAAPGNRSAGLSVTTQGGNKASLGLTGIGNGAGATLDPAVMQTIGNGLTPAAIAVDGQGNVLVADTGSKQLLRFAAGATGSTASGTTVASLNTPVALATDARGNVYVADASGTLTQYTVAGVATVFGTFKSPAGLATDALGNIYISDSTTAAVYEISSNGVAQKTFVGSGLTSPTLLATDDAGLLYIQDTGSIYKYNLGGTAITSVVSPVAHPAAMAVDAAGNILLTDSSTNTITALPASGNTAAFTVASSIRASDLALDGAGDVYTANGSGNLLKLVRTQGAASFGNGAALPASFTLLSTGNVALSVSSLTATDAADYTVTATASMDCTVSGGVTTGVAVGGGCALKAAYAPTTATNTTDTVTFNGNLSNVGLATPAALQLLLSGQNAPTLSTLMLSGPVPAAPMLGQPVSLTATVSAAQGMPAGSVAFSVDGTTPITVMVTSTSATAIFNGLTAGSHTVTATFTATNNFASSMATAVTFLVQAAPTLALAVSPVPTTGSELQGIPLTFAATISTANAPTGKVSFLDGTAQIATGATLNSSGVATYVTSSLAVGPHSITAKFAGDASNAPATSGAVTFTIAAAVTAGATGSTSPLMLTVSAGSSVSAILTYTPNPGYAGTLTFGCSGQPSNVTCNFQPPSLTFVQTNSAAQMTTITINAAATHASIKDQGNPRPLYYALLVSGLLLIAPYRRKFARRLAMLMVLASGFTAISGCGGAAAPTNATFNVTASDGTNTITTPLTLTIR